MLKIFSLFFIFQQLLYALENSDPATTEAYWSIGMLTRTATIPYKTQHDSNRTVSTLIPYISYEGEDFYLRGLEGGGHLYKDDQFEFNLFSRLRFVDIPAQYQNDLQLDTFDLGLQGQYNLQKKHYFNLELMSDQNYRPYANARYQYRYENNRFELRSSLAVKYKSTAFNSYYYGLNQENVYAGISTKASLGLRMHIVNNAYLIAIAEYELLDKNARQSSFVDTSAQTQIYAGLEIGQNKSEKQHKKSGLKEFLRLDMGFGTISDFEDAVVFNRKEDTYQNKLTTIKYGVPLSDSLFTLPIHIYLLNGLTYHWTSEVQPKNIWEYTIAFKVFYTIPTPWRIRLGAAEGFSWASDITYLEGRDGELEGFKSSKFLNHLETSIEISLGDIFGKDMEDFWLGTGVHHRSSIYLLSSQYGRQRVGSNYYTYFLKWELP